MELTKDENRTLVLAVGTAIEHEKVALDRLRHQARDFGLGQAISDRERHMADLERIRKRLIGENKSTSQTLLTQSG
jgi:hypothetical protein